VQFVAPLDVAGGGMVGEAGLEPATPDLEGRCSIQLSYSPGWFSRDAGRARGTHPLNRL
jgi:hypothetical protein